MTNKYIKKQLPVEAVLWNGDNFEEIKEFILSKKPDEIVCEPLEKDIGCTCNYRSFFYKKGTILYYDKKDEKDIFKYGKDRLNHTSCFCTLSLGDYIFDSGSMVLSSLKKEEFEAEYKPQNGSRTSKSSSFSLRDLLKRVVPQHIKCYVEKLEDYGFELVPFREANLTPMEERLLPFTVLKDKNGNKIQIFVRKGDGEKFQLIMPPSYKDRQTKLIKYFMIEVKVINNNWREAFNKLVASFPDEIMKNTNHHAGLTS